jgi:hypothetical protein
VDTECWGELRVAEGDVTNRAAIFRFGTASGQLEAASKSTVTRRRTGETPFRGVPPLQRPFSVFAPAVYYQRLITDSIVNQEPGLGNDGPPNHI